MPRNPLESGSLQGGRRRKRLTPTISDNVSGILVPVGSSEAIHAALQRLLGDAELRRRMGEAGFERILKHHRIEETALKYVQIFTDTSD